MTFAPRPPTDAGALSADAATLGAHARAVIDEELARAIPPGLADVVMRARRIAPERFDDDAIAEATALDELDDERAESAGHFGALGTFLADARTFADAVAEQGVPDAAAPAPLRRTGPRRVTVALVAIAAVAILVPAVSWVLSAIVLDASPERAYSSASDRVARDDDPSTASFQEPAPRVGPHAGPQRVPERAAPEEEVPAPEAAPPIEIVDDPPTAKPRAKSSAPRPSRDDRLRAIDAEARAAWAAGDLATAEAKLVELVRTGGRSTIADVAYGDLFTVLRQRGRAAQLPGHWRRYASRFPEGRYIDEARAGLCRTMTGDDEVECWRAYLRDRPRGTYRQHARDIVERGG